MIIGIGMDLIGTARIARLRERRGERGLRRIFSPVELDYCARLARPDQSLAARFAAKEAFFKALGTGWGRGGTWTEVEVVRASGGRPTLRLHGRAAARARELGVLAIHLTLTHTGELSAAFVVLEG